MSLAFTRRSDYALVALATLARGERLGGVVSARQIAAEHKMPQRLVTNLLKVLQQAGLVHSRRGIQGGYALARPAEGIAVLEVIEAVDGPVRIGQCCAEDAVDTCQACRQAARCPVTRAVQELNEMVVDLLRRVSILDLVEGRVARAAGGGPGLFVERVPAMAAMGVAARR